MWAKFSNKFYFLMKHPQLKKTHKGMIILENNTPQISQINTDLKLPKVVSSVLILGENFLRNLCSRYFGTVAKKY